MDFKDFMTLFYENLSKADGSAPMFAAYEATETIVVEHEGKRKYANYKVFRVVKHRKCKK